MILDGDFVKHPPLAHPSDVELFENEVATYERRIGRILRCDGK
jgi:hypothetical protein